MTQVFGLMILFGAFSFIGFGLCLANSIESKVSKIASNIMSGLSALGLVCFIIGIIGLTFIT